MAACGSPHTHLQTWAHYVCRVSCAGIAWQKLNHIQLLVWRTVTLSAPDLSQFSLASFFHFQFQTEPAHSRFADPFSESGIVPIPQGGPGAKAGSMIR